MIIKGNPAGSVKYWSRHLLRDDTNSRAEVVEMRGILAKDLGSALQQMEAIASGSRSQGNFMYCANINPRDDEHLTPAQWTEAVDTLEKNLGLEGRQRVIVEHEKEGRTHRHIVWNRVDVETLRVADMGGNWRIHTTTARQLEARFELAPTPAPASLPEQKRAPELWEMRAAERSGIRPDTVKEELTQLWKQSDTGRAFAAAVKDRGYVLANGDKPGILGVVDRAGDFHSLVRSLHGVKTAEVREHMADIDRDALPTVAEARKVQKHAERERLPLGQAAGDLRLAWSLNNSADSIAAAIESRGMTFARVDAKEAAASLTASAYAKELGNHAPRYSEGEIVVVNGFGTVRRLDEHATGQTRDQVGKILGGIDQTALLNVKDAISVMKEVAHREFNEERRAAAPMTRTERLIDIFRDEAKTPGAFAATLFREGLTIARVDAPGIEGVARDQRAAFAVDGKGFYTPNLSEGELVAVDRIGKVHRLNPFKLNMEGIELALTGGNKNIPALGYVRDEIASNLEADKAAKLERDSTFWKGVDERRELRDANAQDRSRMKADAERARVTDPQAPKAASALSVIDPVSGLASSLMNFLGSMAGPSKAPPLDPFTREGSRAQFDANRKSEAALESIRDSIAAGEGLKPEDIHHLTPIHIENIKLRGDTYLRSLVAQSEKSYILENDYGRTRER
jgi:Relaxase/Mobilisation nuclease domain